MKPLIHLLFAAVLFVGAMPAQAVSTQTLAEGLNHPWSMAFLPDGRMLVTERAGALRYVSQGGAVSAPIKGLPPIYSEDQGGLLDVVLDPDFAQNSLIYFSFSKGDDDANSTAVARAKLQGDTLQNVRIIFEQKPKVSSSKHYGSRLVFDGNGHLFITLGERFSYREDAQTLDNHHGKLVRIHPDGSVPQDNPFANTKNALPEIYSFGHRNIQGAALHPQTGKLWIHEHGPRGGDEINIPQPGKNYGWPLVSFGRKYIGFNIPDRLPERDDLTYPIYQWTPSIAPSGMMFYTGDKYDGWTGNLFVGALAGSHVARLELDGQKVVNEEQLLTGKGMRFRALKQGPDGLIYILTDSANGKILRLMP